MPKPHAGETTTVAPISGLGPWRDWPNRLSNFFRGMWLEPAVRTHLRHSFAVRHSLYCAAGWLLFCIRGPATVRLGHGRLEQNPPTRSLSLRPDLRQLD
jgi:hypothetical protein